MFPREISYATSTTYRAMLCVLMVCGLWSPTVMADGLEVIGTSGGTAPGTDSTYSAFDIPVVNEAGEVAFHTHLETVEGVLYRAAGDQADIILRDDQVMPGLSDTVSGGIEPAINARGQVAFLGIATGSGEEGVYRGDGSTVIELARTGMQAGDVIGDLYAGDFSLPLFNDAGEVGFRATLEGADSPKGIYRVAEDETRQIARTGQDGLDRIDVPTGMNNHGSIVFTSHQTGETFDSIYRSSGAFADLGDPIFPPGAEVATPGAQIVEVRPDEESAPMVGRQGQVVFNSLTSTLETVPDFLHGAFLDNDIGGLQTIAINEEGSEWQSISVEMINERGQVLLRGNKDDSLSGGYYLLDSRGPGIRPIFDRNNPPEGAEFTEVEGVALGDGSHLVLSAQPAFDEGDPGQNAIYMIDTLSTVESNGQTVGTIDFHEVARTGDELMGSEIVDLFFAKERHKPQDRGLRPSPVVAANERAGVNERGQVTFWFELADGREGIALWSPPRLERVIDGDFDVGLFHWEASGPGIPSVVELTPGEWVGQLLAGSTVTITQTISMPEEASDLGFDVKFLSGEGTLEVALDGDVLEALDASALGPMDQFEVRTIHLDGLAGASDTDLSFTFDGPDGAGVQLDNITLRPIPEAGTMGLLALGALATLRRRKA